MAYNRKNYRSKKTTGRIRKRGFNASFSGFGMKASLGYKRSLQSAVKSIVRRDLETPMHWIVSEQSQVVKQNTHYTLNPFAAIPQGDTFGSRNGDVIHLDTLKVKCQMSPNTTNAVSHVRLLLVKSTERYSPASTWVSGIGSTDLYINNPTNPTAHGIIDPKKCSVIFDKLVKFKASVSSQIMDDLQTFSVPLNTTFTYETGTTYGKHSNYYFVVIPNQPGGVTGTTDIATVYISFDAIFKNCR